MALTNDRAEWAGRALEVGVDPTVAQINLVWAIDDRITRGHDAYIGSR